MTPAGGLYSVFRDGLFEVSAMPSIVSPDESVAVSYVDGTDDVKSIRRDCDTAEKWQSQLIRSLQYAGWTPGMLLYLPAPIPLHWILTLQHECSFRLLNELTLKASAAYRICGTDRRNWMALACRCLQSRGWTPTMQSRAWDIPKTNIYRFLEVDLAASDGAVHWYGHETEHPRPESVAAEAI